MGVGLRVGDVFEELRETRAVVDVLGGIVGGYRCPLVEINHRNLVRCRPCAKRAGAAEGEGKNDHKHNRE